MYVRMFISEDSQALQDKLSEFKSTVTIMPEYNKLLVRGTTKTLVNNCCIGGNLNVNVDAIGMSGFDLNILGGILRVLNIRGTGNTMFWRIVSMVQDANGLYKLREIRKKLWDESRSKYYFDSNWELSMDQLYGFLAWYDDNKLIYPKNAKVTDCTEYVNEAIQVLTILLEADDDILSYRLLVQNGYDWVEKYSVVY